MKLKQETGVMNSESLKEDFNKRKAYIEQLEVENAQLKE